MLGRAQTWSAPAVEAQIRCPEEQCLNTSTACAQAPHVSTLHLNSCSASWLLVVTHQAVCTWVGWGGHWARYCKHSGLHVPFSGSEDEETMSCTSQGAEHTARSVPLLQPQRFSSHASSEMTSGEGFAFVSCSVRVVADLQCACPCLVRPLLLLQSPPASPELPWM